MARSHVFSASKLTIFAEEILVALSVPQPKARLVAESLVAANLRGVDSHGIHLLPHYVRHLRGGTINAAAEGRIVSESGCCLLFDGESGFGQHVSSLCCQHAIRLAKNLGIGFVVARNSSHFGAAAFWANRISREGLIGLVMGNASPCVAPWQGKEGRLGTNPICVSVPSDGEGGWLLDMATTTVAMNKILNAAERQEEELPTGWAMDSEGEPTTDPLAALKGLLMPLGGYKGSGLAMMVEIFCAVLGGGRMSTEVGGVYRLDRTMGTSQAFLALDVSRFLPLDEFQTRMERLVKSVKSAAPARGFSEVLVAGDPEWRQQERRLREGIMIEETPWSRLVSLAEEVGVTVPEAEPTV